MFYFNCATSLRAGTKRGLHAETDSECGHWSNWLFRQQPATATDWNMINLQKQWCPKHHCFCSLLTFCFAFWRGRHLVVKFLVRSDHTANSRWHLHCDGVTDTLSWWSFLSFAASVVCTRSGRPHGRRTWWSEKVIRFQSIKILNRIKACQ